MESAAISEIFGAPIETRGRSSDADSGFSGPECCRSWRRAGNVTKLIKERWPAAAVVGVEGSVEMVAAGKKTAPELEWLHQDLGSWHPAQKYDLIYSNAALHWLSDHGRLFPSLMEKVEPGGILAVQMPRNFGAPSHLLIAETALNRPGRRQLEHLETPPHVGKARMRQRKGPRAPG